MYFGGVAGWLREVQPAIPVERFDGAVWIQRARGKYFCSR